ncbi:MAG: hypothetical protein H7Z17_02650 [Fuerstia sp.]|nr:hypothetical protein [Fuerstiella sp.]
MSRRSPSPGSQRTSDKCNPSARTTAVLPVAEQTSAPSLESLLASCGALQSVIRKNEDTNPYDEFRPDADQNSEPDDCRMEVAACTRTADELVDSPADLSPAEPSQPEPVDSDVACIAPSGDVAALMNSLRQEFRASIDELKSAQSAAAASQSAVLKTLTEIIFQSSSMRGSSGDGLEEKLAAAEERILSRINQFVGAANVSGPKESAGSTSAGSGRTTPVQKAADRSWAEIRDELMVNDGVENTSVAPVRPESDRTLEESDSTETVAAEHECRLEVPRAVDVESLNERELRAAFYEREAFILTLIGRLRHQHQKSSGHLPADQLKSMAGHLPEDLALQVLQTLQQLDELARIGELELSLERARLSRQVSQLNDSRHVIEHNARQMGLTLAADGTLSNPHKQTTRSSGSRRWLSKLGFGQ